MHSAKQLWFGTKQRKCKTINSDKQINRPGRLKVAEIGNKGFIKK